MAVECLTHLTAGLLLLLVPVMSFSQDPGGNLPAVRFEHLRINVADKEETAKWYVETAGLEALPSTNAEVIYVADKDHNFMLELSSIPNIRNRYFDIHIDAFHLAFEGDRNIEVVADQMLGNRGLQEGKLYRNLMGDYVMNVRDINGFTSQLIHRANPFYPKPRRGTIRFEHFALNTPDQKTSALWYCEFMGLTIPWSKDIDTSRNSFRTYRVPYIGDAGRNMSLELFGRHDVPIGLAQLKHDEVHIGFSTDDPEELAKRIVYGGGTKVGETRREENGDIVIDLYDPHRMPIRLIKRQAQVLQKAEDLYKVGK